MVNNKCTDMIPIAMMFQNLNEVQIIKYLGSLFENQQINDRVSFGIYSGAVMRNYDKLMLFLLKANKVGPDENVLRVASEKKNVDIFKYLIENEYDFCVNRYLNKAVYDNSFEIAKYLVGVGANVNNSYLEFEFEHDIKNNFSSKIDFVKWVLNNNISAVSILTEKYLEYFYNNNEIEMCYKFIFGCKEEIKRNTGLVGSIVKRYNNLLFNNVYKNSCGRDVIIIF